ncbi:MAG: tripartite tricarboxylate transporter TctB family protein [Alphaproteobacteria bacterium]
MQNPRTELAFALFFTVLILIGIFFTYRIDLAFSSDLEVISGPRAYPGMILSVLLLLNLIAVATYVSRILRDADTAASWSLPIPGNFMRSVGLLVALTMFVLVFEPVGYILTVVPLMTLSALLFGERSPMKAFIVSVSLAAVCLLIFRYGLATVLPEGVLGIDMII